MPTLGGTKVIAPIRPNDSLDQYPSHEARYGKGGFRTVDTITERCAISTDRREAGMLCYVVTASLTYQLEADLVSWHEFTAGSGGGGTSATIANLSSITDVCGDASAGDLLGFDGTNWVPVQGAAAASSTIVTSNLVELGPIVTVDNSGDVIYSLVSAGTVGALYMYAASGTSVLVRPILNELNMYGNKQYTVDTNI